MKLSLGPLQPYLHNRKVQIGAGVVAVLVVGGAVSAFALNGGGSNPVASSTPPAPTPTATTSVVTPSEVPTPTTQAAKVDPLTGEKVSTKPVVAVKIDDTANGRPQLNIDKADVVYIEQAEGGLSRLLAVFHTQLPQVEAVRSTRASDPELMAQYGPVNYVATGGGGNTLQVLANSNLHAAIMDRGDAGFVRDNNRHAPYNVIADLAAIAKDKKGAGAKDIGWTWGATSAPALKQAKAIHTVVGSTSVDFVYDAHTNRYNRVIDGVVQKAADGTVISTPNVIVQRCTVTTYPGDVDVNGNPSQFTHSVGTGKVSVFRDGKLYTGTWKRPTSKDGTALTAANGAPIALATGGAWVALVNSGADVSVS